ncbi:MAG: hypothetical protein KDA60_03745 [Planctomycetales bacterium]|nr:hypothetical protein [Planctomycetales bacterium]
MRTLPVQERTASPLEHRRPRQAPFVVFSGVDGAGKSTQIDTLRAHFVATGRVPAVIWARGGYTPGINGLKNLARRILGRKRLPPAGQSPQRDRAFSHSGLRRLWLVLAILDLGCLYACKIRWHRLCGRPVICDRYWQDTALDFRLNFTSEHVERWWLWRSMTWLCPRPTHQFLLIVPVDESIRRSAQKKEPFPDTPEVMQQRFAEYSSWADQAGWCCIDGTRPACDISHEISERVKG